jgi:hypothetical protein
MIKKIGIVLAETLASFIGLVGVILFIGGLLICKLAISIYTALEDANDS